MLNANFSRLDFLSPKVIQVFKIFKFKGLITGGWLCGWRGNGNNGKSNKIK